VSWGDGGEEGVGGAVEVNWGEIDAGDGAAAGGALEVDWDGAIEVEAGGDGASPEEVNLVELLGLDDKRGLLLDDLYELLAFLTQRAVESSAGAEGLPLELALDRSELSAHIDATRSVCDLLDCEHTRHLLQLHSSERYLERQVAALRQLLTHADKMNALADGLRTRQAELLITIKSAYPRYEAAAAKVRALKLDLEGALSARHYNGRPINLMGVDV